MKYEIYLINNKLNNKRYIGQTSSNRGYLNRFKEHCYESLRTNKSYDEKSLLHKAIYRYGVENFELSLIESDIDETDIDEIERKYIKLYNTFYRNHQGYNMTEGGSGVSNYKFTKAVQLKISDNVRKYWVTLKTENRDEYNRLCKLRSTNMLGKPKSEMHKKHLSESRLNSGAFARENNAFYGKHHSEASRQKISDGNSKPVGAYGIESDELLIKFKSIYEASCYLIDNHITTNTSCSSRISKICRGIDKSAYGYKWKYLE